MHDTDLIHRWRTGDREAFAMLIERHQRTVYGFVRARLLDARDAERITEDVFLRFYESRTRFDSAALVQPWLLSIARTLLQDYVRDMRRRKDVSWTELCLELETVLPADSSFSEDARSHLSDCLN